MNFLQSLQPSSSQRIDQRLFSTNNENNHNSYNNDHSTFNSILTTTNSTLSSTSTSSTSTSTSSYNHNHHHSNKILSKILPLCSNGNTIKISLVEPIIIFRGNAHEATGSFLRGVLELNLKKPTKIRKLELKFIGKTKAFFPEMVFSNDSSISMFFLEDFFFLKNV